MKHHEAVQLRKQRSLVFVGYTADGKKEIYKSEMTRPDIPRHKNVEYKFSSQQWKRESHQPSEEKVKVPRYVRPPGPRKISYKHLCERPVQTWRKEPRRAYCTGCGFTFTHMHLLRIHRDTEKCGGRFLSEAEREMLNKLRLERESQDRWKSAMDSMPPIRLTKAEKKAWKAIRLARREADLEQRRSVRAAFCLT